MSGKISKALLLLALIGHLCMLIVSAGEAEFSLLQTKVEQTVLEFRDVVETAYASRCDVSNIEQCYQGNYLGCLSSFPNAVCPAPNEFSNGACSNGPDCSSIVDYSVSSIRFPPLSSTSSLDSNLVQSTCFSQNLDDYFVSKRQEDEAYWESWGVESPWFHFSATSGMFRIYPARPDKTCFSYDPRIRPFYVAGSSGPKNVLLLLDTSGSMDGLRMEYMKEAAERVVDTLNVGDRIALIPFATFGESIQIHGQSLVKASSNAKEELKMRIRNLQAVGSTNFYDAFRRAFLIMEEAILKETLVDCNTAVIFLTDGQMTEPRSKSESEVLQYIQNGLEQMQVAIGSPVRLFTYSISQDTAVHSFPRALACSSTTPGVWSQIAYAEDIVSSLSSYYKLFAMGLSNNNDFTAWIEPYEFFSSKITGTTVSAPVFDRTVYPPVLIGVVAIDFPMSALDRALGVKLGSTITFDRVVRSSTAMCPDINISSCLLESFRLTGPSGQQARCDPACPFSDLPMIEGQPCPNHDDFPTRVIENSDLEDLDFLERSCCEVGTNVPSDQCRSKASSERVVKIVAIVAGVAILCCAMACCFGCCYFLVYKPSKKTTSPNGEATSETESNTVTQSFEDLHVLQPPTNPHVSSATAPTGFDTCTGADTYSGADACSGADTCGGGGDTSSGADVCSEY